MNKYSKYHKRDLGKRGEYSACMFLVKHGFSVLRRNYSNRIGEIDIIAEKSGVLHFIEVKSVSRETFGGHNCSDNSVPDFHSPEENIDNRKISKLERVASLYLAQNKLDNKQIQFDAITAVFLMGGGMTNPAIEYIPNINL